MCKESLPLTLPVICAQGWYPWGLVGSTLNPRAIGCARLSAHNTAHLDLAVINGLLSMARKDFYCTVGHSTLPFPSLDCSDRFAASLAL